MTTPLTPRYAVIIPACNEEECIERVLAELRAVVDARQFKLVVGVNGSTDRTAELAREAGAVAVQTAAQGYGRGCQAAIDHLEAGDESFDAYIFFAGDGANDPRDIAALVTERVAGAEMVLGCRTRTRSNWSRMNLHYVIANRFFGFLCGCLTGRFFADLGSLRLIDRKLFRALRLQEWTFGWTIEAQVRAARLGARIIEVPVRERSRFAGKQKVSHVSWRRTLAIGWKIAAAGLRARFRDAQLLEEAPRSRAYWRACGPGARKTAARP